MLLFILLELVRIPTIQFWTHLTTWLKTKKWTILSVNENGEQLRLSYCWWGCKIIQPPWKTMTWCLTQLNKYLLYVPALPVPVYTQQKWVTISTTHLIKLIVIVILHWKQTVTSIHARIKKLVFLYNGILLRNKREPTNETWKNMNIFQNHYVETKKLDTKENLLLYDSHNMKFRTGKIIFDDRSQNRGGMGWGG